MLLFGTEGYLFNKPDLTHTQFILAMILGSMLKGDFTEIPPPARSLMFFMLNPIYLLMFSVAAFFQLHTNKTSHKKPK